MNAVQPIAEIFPAVVAHIHERTAMDATDNRPVDPDRAAHEIGPDAWHASVGVARSNCPYCHDDEGAQR